MPSACDGDSVGASPGAVLGISAVAVTLARVWSWCAAIDADGCEERETCVAWGEEDATVSAAEAGTFEGAETELELADGVEAARVLCGILVWVGLWEWIEAVDPESCESESLEDSGGVTPSSTAVSFPKFVSSAPWDGVEPLAVPSVEERVEVEEGADNLESGICACDSEERSAVEDACSFADGEIVS